MDIARNVAWWYGIRIRDVHNDDDVSPSLSDMDAFNTVIGGDGIKSSSSSLDREKILLFTPVVALVESDRPVVAKHNTSLMAMV